MTPLTVSERLEKDGQGCISTRKETRLSYAEHETGGKEAFVACDETHQRHDGAPGNDDGGEEDARSQSFQERVRERLEQGI